MDRGPKRLEYAEWLGTVICIVSALMLIFDLVFIGDMAMRRAADPAAYDFLVRHMPAAAVGLLVGYGLRRWARKRLRR